MGCPLGSPSRYLDLSLPFESGTSFSPLAPVGRAGREHVLWVRRGSQGLELVRQKP